MPKIVVTSDLHLGITSVQRLRALVEQIRQERPDLTVLAGDIGEPLINFAACLDLFKDLPGAVAVLAGNHDVWATDGHHSQQLWERELPRATRDAGMLWLEEDTWRQDGLAVLGSLAWYDYSAVDPELLALPAEYFAAHKARFNLDARWVDWPWSDGEYAQALGDGLCERLARAQEDAAVRAIVVVTHVPLFEAQMCRKPGDRNWGFSNAYFGNLTLGQRVLGASKLCHVISGHTHMGRAAFVARPQFPTLPPLPAVVVPSEYEDPAYVAVEVAP